jgi:hypothetical protein
MLVLASCATPPPPEPGIVVSDSVPTHRNGQLDFELASGNYICELGQQVEVRREVTDNINNRIQLGWKGRTYLLVRDPSHSGLPRFEDSHSGLVWIDLPWKGMLLEARTHKPLANECRSA